LSRSGGSGTAGVELKRFPKGIRNLAVTDVLVEALEVLEVLEALDVFEALETLEALELLETTEGAEPFSHTSTSTRSRASPFESTAYVEEKASFSSSLMAIVVSSFDSLNDFLEKTLARPCFFFGLTLSSSAPSKSTGIAQ
jgi:hypothetical protein